MAEDKVYVNQASPRAVGEGNWMPAKATKRGELCVIDFYTQMALEGRGYQVRAGTVTTAYTGDTPVVDTKAEMCVDAPSGITIMPVEAWVSIDSSVGDAEEIAGKSVATASTGGDAFVPLPLLIGGVASRCSARWDETGGVTVTADLVTTTVRHFHVSHEFAPIDGVDPNVVNPVIWTPATPPVLPGIRCFYLQIGGAAATKYFAHFDYVELLTSSVE